jgi:hypothetical protein
MKSPGTTRNTKLSISVLFGGSLLIKGEKKVRAQSKSDPWRLFLTAMKSPATKENYLIRLVVVSQSSQSG